VILAYQSFSYLHTNGLIHRDIKAANLLIDDDGTVLLGDLGVAASLVDDLHDHSKVTTPNRRINFDAAGSHGPHAIVSNGRPNIGKRKSFVGTVRADNKYVYLNMLTFSLH
jgi:serine/threonine-protein kinase OSR1/STK39